LGWKWVRGQGSRIVFFQRVCRDEMVISLGDVGVVSCMMAQMWDPGGELCIGEWAGAAVELCTGSSAIRVDLLTVDMMGQVMSIH
jgi:hypothetical protein